jgi:predicted transcriptional regulator
MQHTTIIDLWASIDRMDKKLASRLNRWRLAQPVSMTPEEAIRELLDRALKADAAEQGTTPPDIGEVDSHPDADKVEELIAQFRRATASR